MKKCKQKCMQCGYFKKGGRQQTQKGRRGRLKFFCTHARADELQYKMTVNGSGGFVCFSDMVSDEPTVKTAPKWCPLNQEDSNEQA